MQAMNGTVFTTYVTVLATATVLLTQKIPEQGGANFPELRWASGSREKFCFKILKKI